ncbi:EAL domain-containing protein [Myxosarcina sp. GI1]|uniref:EAL domain-containing protein n=1 Tax=Myxosarcina sp. GI1 TaxID=1541065 RepID=UPI00209D0A08|nr:EAL domain-containing protein [Myxosarcina sp. GI1]
MTNKDPNLDIYNRNYILSILFVTIIITFILSIIRRLGGLQLLELTAYDWMVNLHTKNKLDTKLLVVEITDADIEQLNRWPIADATFAKLLQNLQQYNPKAIGLDIYRDITHPPGSLVLARQLQRENVITIEYLGSGENRVSSPPGVPEERVGFNDIVLDVDGVLRRNLMYARLGDRDLYSFALRLSLLYLQDRQLEFQVNPDSLKIGDKIITRLKPNSGGYQMPPSEAVGWQILLDYSYPNVARRISLTEALSGKLEPDLVTDKIVIIGTSAPSIKDIFYTPYHGSKALMPGAIAHAHMVGQILGLVLDERRQFWFWWEWTETVWIWGWSLVGAVIAWKLRHPLSIAGAGFFSAIGLWSICSLAFVFSGWIPLVSPMLAFLLSSGLVLGYKVLYTLFYDSLTGLPNRLMFARQLTQLKQNNQFVNGTIAVLCLDLNRFKLINEGLGYEAGDRLLIYTARRLKKYLNAKAILARIGADEFGIAFKVTDGSTEAIDLATEVESELATEYRLKEQTVFISVSVGLAIAQLQEDFSPEELIRASHTAMYKAKASGKSRYQIFANKMHEQAFKRLELEADLQEAIVNCEFELHYQPIISLITGQLAGFEALVRWQSPKRGFVSPGAFIPIAEETGLIVPLGKWILETACCQLSQWQQQFDGNDSLLISVNLSSRQFAQPDLVEQVEHILVSSNLDAKNLKLEITESMVMDNVEDTIVLLNRLKNLGIKLSMDDFGTGFSSFSYLHRFPMDTLKIDRSFVSNMSNGTKNQEIVSTIVMLAHKLNMDVIAEGIETETEKQILQSLNCEYGQGYFFAKPLTIVNATKLLADKKSW